MAIEVDSRKICAVYALGEWHPVAPNSICFDAYELIDHEQYTRFGHEDTEYREGSGGYIHMRYPHVGIYYLGDAYPATESRGEHLADRTHRMRVSGDCGVRWLNPETEEIVCVSLLEIKGWRMLSEEKATEANPYLDRERGNELMHGYWAQEARRREKEEEAREAMAEQAAAT